MLVAKIFSLTPSKFNCPSTFTRIVIQFLPLLIIPINLRRSQIAFLQAPLKLMYFAFYEEVGTTFCLLAQRLIALSSIMNTYQHVDFLSFVSPVQSESLNSFKSSWDWYCSRLTTCFSASLISETVPSSLGVSNGLISAL